MVTTHLTRQSYVSFTYTDTFWPGRVCLVAGVMLLDLHAVCVFVGIVMAYLTWIVDWIGRLFHVYARVFFN